MCVLRLIRHQRAYTYDGCSHVVHILCSKSDNESCISCVGWLRSRNSYHITATRRRRVPGVEPVFLSKHEYITAAAVHYSSGVGCDSHSLLLGKTAFAASSLCICLQHVKVQYFTYPFYTHCLCQSKQSQRNLLSIE